MEEAFRAILLASSGVTALVGSRVSWGEQPQGAAFPAIVLTLISANNDATMGGPDRLFQSRVQVDGYALSYGAVKALQRAVLAALDGYSGGNMQGIFHAGTRDGREGGTNEADRPFRVSMDFMTNWSD
jgi:hypothetical protein